MANVTGKAHVDILREYGLDNELQNDRVLDVIKSAPVPLGAVIPDGWVLKAHGLYQSKFSKDGEELEAKLISYEPIVISGLFENLTDESEGFIVSWFDGREWKEIVRSRDHFMDSNKIIDLALYGFPVDSNNTKKLIQYLKDFHAVNRLKLHFKSYSEQLGWFGNGFLLGNQYISTGEKEIHFYPADVGEKQLVEGFNAQGDINRWLDIIDRLQGYPNVIIGIYASLASVLSSILKVDSFIFEWSGETSKGKSISMKVAASVWGNPSTDQGGIIKKWNVTPVNIERTASLLKHLPLFLDDTKDLSGIKTVSNLIYNLASGQGRGRGSVNGSQKTRYWNNITFSTGEQKITTFAKDGGTVGRVIPIVNLPFGKADAETSQLVEGIEIDLQECYGVAGEKWIRFILDNRENWDMWKGHYRTFRQTFSEQANGNSVVGRLAKYMALLATAAMIFNDCFEKNYDYQSILKTVWEQIIEENGEVDRPLQAVRCVFEWAVSNQVRFDDGNGFKSNDDYGIWNPQSEWQEIFFYPNQLSRFLEKQGYESTSIMKSWVDRGWLNVSKNRGYRKQKKIKNTQIDFISIKRGALEQ
ncbi:DUF927 domain-containing protein [Peribacillus loiseleuriae]|uniref:DUF927 domain-containing protein n=1 Tax=Peribacillus loiseleuriae TaxID=1679170 RepID=UPI0038206E3F